LGSPKKALIMHISKLLDIVWAVSGVSSRYISFISRHTPLKTKDKVAKKVLLFSLIPLILLVVALTLFLSASKSIYHGATGSITVAMMLMPSLGYYFATRWIFYWLLGKEMRGKHLVKASELRAEVRSLFKFLAVIYLVVVLVGVFVGLSLL